MIQIDLFNDDERQYFNSLTKGRDRGSLTRKSVLSNIAFAREATDSMDIMVLDLIDGLYSKVNALSDDEWEELRMFFPLPVNISIEDNVDNEALADNHEDEIDV